MKVLLGLFFALSLLAGSSDSFVVVAVAASSRRTLGPNDGRHPPRPAGVLQASVESESTTSTDSNPPSVSVPLPQLNECLRSFNGSSCAKEILDQINGLRGQNDGQEAVSKYLDDLLESGPDSDTLPFWSKIRPLARISNRARQRSLRRLLDVSTPPPAMDKEDEDEESRQQRRRRALVSVLRELASSTDTDELNIPAVRYLEKKARAASKANSQSEDMRSRLPDGLETPVYNVLKKQSTSGGGYEIRRYEPFSVCSVSVGKPRPVEVEKTDAKVSMPQMAGASSFGALAGYLFGKNQQSSAMKMTTPVLTNGEGDDKQMSFVLPSDYWNESGVTDAPQPLPESGVILRRDEGGDRAVVMFGGYASTKEIDAQSARLLQDLEEDKDWRPVDETIAIAQYNDPFTPPWKRLNEVSVRVVSRQ